MIKLLDVYKEIFSRLKTLPYRVYDEVPDKPSNPHIRIDYSYNLDRSGKNYGGTTYYQYIHVFSEYSGRKEVLQMVDDIMEILSEDLETDDFVAYPFLDSNEVITESANTGGDKTGYNINKFYRHVILVYKYVIYEK